MKIARRTMKVEVPAVAMGDIIFNLLVFFFILANANDDSQLKWERASTPKIEEVGQARVRVTVDEENKVYVNGRQVGVDQVKDEIDGLLGNAPLGQRTVMLRIHKNTQAVTFEPIIEAVSQVGGELVHVLTEDKPGG